MNRSRVGDVGCCRSIRGWLIGEGDEEDGLGRNSEVRSGMNEYVDGNALLKLCYLLENIGGPQNERFISVSGKVVSFQLIHAHHTKNAIVKKSVKKLGECKVVLGLWRPVLKFRCPITYNCITSLRKCETMMNVLGMCNCDMNFVYILTGWESSTVDGCVLQDALSRPHGLQVPAACVLLHNFICTQMDYDPFEVIVLDESVSDEKSDANFIDTIGSSSAYNTWKDKLAAKMFHLCRDG
ncbi:hypothetical protein CDL12_28777 [Handroanthus impetiginosus]|uniref:Uncharacterized protein n=1 Tax=Handroanthus impetiginosus TaxID=429701 RepID=A0A2G9G091_9LAMI|nr:hypothetical protein CDL12_28777 [Handroanthus impetiginosus]